MDDHLASILTRKRLEVARRRRHAWRPVRSSALGADRVPDDVDGLLRRRGRGLPQVIAEIKHASPSAGTIRPRRPGAVARIAQSLVTAGASAISVLVDRAGFGGSVLDVRRVAASPGMQRVPVLYKEFVVDESQVAVADAVGAALVLLLVRALDDARLRALVRECRARGLHPVVEAADEGELERAIATDAEIIGINARDLATFRVAPVEARRLVEKVPDDRIAVYMSGVGSRQDLHALAGTRADAVLIGEGLMRTADPGATLAEWLR